MCVVHEQHSTCLHQAGRQKDGHQQQQHRGNDPASRTAQAVCARGAGLAVVGVGAGAGSASVHLADAAIAGASCHTASVSSAGSAHCFGARQVFCPDNVGVATDTGGVGALGVAV